MRLDASASHESVVPPPSHGRDTTADSVAASTFAALMAQIVSPPVADRPEDPATNEATATDVDSNTTAAPDDAAATVVAGSTVTTNGTTNGAASSATALRRMAGATGTAAPRSISSGALITETPPIEQTAATTAPTETPGASVPRSELDATVTVTVPAAIPGAPGTSMQSAPLDGAGARTTNTSASASTGPPDTTMTPSATTIATSGAGGDTANPEPTAIDAMNDAAVAPASDRVAREDGSNNDGPERRSSIAERTFGALARLTRLGTARTDTTSPLDTSVDVTPTIDTATTAVAAEGTANATTPDPNSTPGQGTAAKNDGPRRDETTATIPAGATAAGSTRSSGPVPSPVGSSAGPRNADPIAVSSAMPVSSGSTPRLTSSGAVAPVDPGPVVVPPSPSEQLVSVIAPLRSRANGTYQVTLELHPRDLGKVEVELRVDHGIVNVMMRAEHTTTGSLLRDNLADLRDRLENEGVHAGQLNVDAHGADDGTRRQFDLRDETKAGPPPVTSPPTTAADPGVTITALPDSALDVRL